MRKTLFNRSIFAAAALALAVMFSAFQDKGKYTLTGQFSELPDGTVIEMIPAGSHKEEKPVGTATVKSGQFTFSGSVAGPRYYFLRIAGTYSGFPVMVENADITVTGKTDAGQDGSRQFKDVKSPAANRMPSTWRRAPSASACPSCTTPIMPAARK